MKTMSMIAVMAAAVVLGGAPAVRAEVPTAEDFAACNAKAADEARTASAAPAGQPSGRPDDARGGMPAASPRSGAPVTTPGGPSAQPVDPSGKTITSDDPQLEGMAADRAHEPQYVAAYRSCMRQRGF
jgi:hypothetical protein